MLWSDRLRSRVAIGVCITLLASLFPSPLRAQTPGAGSKTGLRIAVVKCADLTGESVPGLAALLDRSLWKSLADQPGVEVVKDAAEATRLLSAQITEVTRPVKKQKKGGGQVEIAAEMTDPQTGALTYRAVVRGGGFSRPGEAVTTQIERAVSEAAEQIAVQVVRSERLRGSVVRTERGASATVDLGSDDGLTIGTELEVVRGEEVVGHLRVDRVVKQEASGLLFDVKSGNEVAIGDQVRISSSPAPVLPGPPTLPGKRGGGNKSWVWVVGALALAAIVALAASGRGDHGVGGGQVYLVAGDQQIPANGTSTTTVTATVRDSKGNPAADGVRVRFQTSLGIIAPARVPLKDGVATATLTSAPTPGTATITASAGRLSQTTTVEFTPTPGPGIAAHLAVDADPTQIPADDTSTSTITATVTDRQNNPVPDGTLVKFSTSLGIVAPATASTVGGAAEATLRSGRQAGTATVTAKVDQLVETVDVEFVSAVAAELTVEADPEQIPADGTSTSTITATVSDPQHNPVPDGTVVRFTTSLGLIGPATVGTFGGVATATLHSGTNPGTATVTVRAEALTERVSVEFLDATPARLTVTAEPTQISADGTSTSTITAAVSDVQNNPVPDGTQVTFSTSLGTINPATAKTTSGSATAALRSSTRAGTATVTVKAGTLTRRVKVEFQSTKPARLVVKADPEEIPADGHSTSTITATVSDAQNNPVPDGTVVTFTTSLGMVSPGSVETQGGTATATLQSGEDPGTATVTVTVKTLTQQLQVEFLDTTPAHLSLKADPPRIPADGTSTSTITATVTDAQNNPVPDGTLVKFSTSLGFMAPATADTQDGTASATLHSGTEAGTAAVTVKVGTLTKQVQVVLADATPAYLTVTAQPKQIAADGTSTSTVTAVVSDAQHNPVPDRTLVTFTTSLGVVGPATAETTDGTATATLTSGTTPGTATVTVKVGMLTQRVKVEFLDTTPTSLTVKADPEEIPADDTSTSTITATVKDAQNDPVPDGTIVKFTTSLGTIAPSSAATQDGAATATLRSGTTAATATVTVKVGALTQKVKVEFLDTTPAYLTISADPSQLPADGISTSTITATVSDAQHNPVPDGTAVRFTTTLGVIGPGSVDTQGGIATATLHSSTTAGTAKVTVKVGTLTESITVKVVVGTPAHVVAAADPTEIPADGTSTSTITALVSDASNNPVPDGTVVKFTTSQGLIGPATATTTDGIATATLHSDTTVGGAWVTAKVGTLVGKVRVKFTTPP
jgi:adhesin/invasin